MCKLSVVEFINHSLHALTKVVQQYPEPHLLQASTYLLSSPMMHVTFMKPAFVQILEVKVRLSEVDEICRVMALLLISGCTYVLASCFMEVITVNQC